MIKAIVTDIEGTTTSLSFVKDILFPYARKNISSYVIQNEAKLEKILDDVRKEEKNLNLSTLAIIDIFLKWMDEDRKATPLKSLQGLIWEAGYKAGDFQGHIYDDAAQALQNWHRSGIKLYIYSSGSVAAQKLLFSHTSKGDLTPLFSGYFDTTTGPKLESESYTKIAQAIDLLPGNILFLSDHPGEIEAANASGMQTILIDREEKEKIQPTVTNFKAIQLEERAA